MSRREREQPPVYSGPEITVTRPDADGQPVELLVAGTDEVRELPRWAKRSLAGAVALALLVSLGSEGVERWQDHRAEQRAADALVIRPGQSGGGGEGGLVQVAIGLRNEGPRPVRLRDPRLTAPGLEGIVGVTAPESVEPGTEGSLVATIEAVCPVPDLTATRFVVSVTAVAESGRDERLELDLTTVPTFLEQACRVPSPADDLQVEVDEARLDGDALRVRLSLETGSGGAGELTGVASALFDRVTSRTPLPLALPGVGGVGLELELQGLRCDVGAVRDVAEGRIVTLPLDLVVRGVDGSDRSVAGTGRGTRRGSSDPARGGLVVGRQLDGGSGPGGVALVKALLRLADRCPAPAS